MEAADSTRASSLGSTDELLDFSFMVAVVVVVVVTMVDGGCR